MVARIRIGKSIRGALSYNEAKLRTGRAELILASGFPVEESLLGFSAKMRRFQYLIDRNPRVQTNALHISLNFPPEERLSTEKLQRIALEYMERIGFADQPFLVYRHMDAGHPHIHLVTTNLRVKGRPINLHNIAKLRSEPARKALEQEFSLIRAENRANRYGVNTSISPWPATYGKEETKHAITSIVGSIISDYKFSSLEELNVILGQFRVTAQRGFPGSKMQKSGGLIFSLLDKDGRRVGAPIKASAIDGSPTLINLQKRFMGGIAKKVAVVELAKKRIMASLRNRPGRGTVLATLEKNNIGVVVERSDQGVTDIHFVDHRLKAVFSAQELGLTVEQVEASIRGGLEDGLLSRQGAPHAPIVDPPTNAEHVAIPAATLTLLQTLFANNSEDLGGADELVKRKKKKRKGLGH